MEPNKEPTPAEKNPSNPQQDQPARKQENASNSKGVAVAEVVGRYRSAFDDADTGSGSDRKGKKDGMLDVFEAANAIVLMQGSKLQATQIQLLSKLRPEDKVKIDDIVKPFEDGLKALDKDGDGFLSPTELEKPKAKDEGQKKESLKK